MGNQANTWVGAIAVIGMGVITVAAIYQLNQAPNVTNAAQSIATNTLAGLFK